MYAVVSSGGKQYRVEPGTTLTMERTGAGIGEPFTFDRVLLIGNGDEVTVGTPVVAGASVSATVLGEEPGPKLVIFKFKQKVKYRRRTGHRQHLVRVRIDAINADGKSTKAPAQAPVKAEPATKPRRASRAKAEKAAAQPTAEEPTAAAKPRARRKPASAAAKAEAAEASAQEEKPKARRTSRGKAAAKQPAETEGDKAQEQ
jgi:large subunit ribosomal protein L21